jgi:hypothetical protein
VNVRERVLRSIFESHGFRRAARGDDCSNFAHLNRGRAETRVLEDRCPPQWLIEDHQGKRILINEGDARCRV